MGNIENYDTVEQPFPESDSKDFIEQYPYTITYEDIANIEFATEDLEYRGEGATAYLKKNDAEKIKWLGGLGIELSPEADRREIVSAFIITRDLILLKAIYGSNINQENGDIYTDKALRIVNKRLQEGRIDRVGNREQVTADGKLLEEIAEQNGFNINASKQLSVSEYNVLISNILFQLTEKKG